MSATRRAFIAAIASTALIGAVSGAGAADTIKIGDINSYTGMTEFTGPYKNGAELALEKINAEGGVLGKKLELITRDDKGQPGEAVKAAQELFARDGVALISGASLSNVGLALTSYAKQRKHLYIASEPLADSVVWANGNKYTFRLRPSTYMQADMLAEAAAKLGKKRWATIAPNYSYGKEAVADFEKLLKKRQPDVEFVAEQWPGLFKIDAGAEVQALAAAKPDAIFNVTFGPDLAKFVREGQTRGLFKDKLVVGLLTGEPEYLDPLKGEAPKGWLVTGYPWYAIDTPEHKAFLDAYQKKFHDYPRLGSVVGYDTMMTAAAALKKAGSTDTDALVKAMSGLTIDTPLGKVTYRPIDHQSTMGAFVGTLAVKDGKGIMVDWSYKDGANYQPSDAEVKKMRPAED
jgi:branched-chain amino acid transport system substrate-binding protein